MDITKDTKLMDILDAYPWLADELTEINPRFKLLDSTMGRIFMKNATIEDLSKKVGKDPERLVRRLEEIIAKHEGRD